MNTDKNADPLASLDPDAQAQLCEKVANLLDELHGLCEKNLSKNHFLKVEKHVDAIGETFSILGGFGSSASNTQQLPDEALAALERQDVTIIPTPDLPEWVVLTVGAIDDLTEWFDDREGPGNVYLLWYVLTPHQRADYAERLRPVVPNAEGPAIMCLDSLGYATVYPTEEDARADLADFVAKGRPERVRIPLDPSP